MLELQEHRLQEIQGYLDNPNQPDLDEVCAALQRLADRVHAGTIRAPHVGVCYNWAAEIKPDVAVGDIDFATSLFTVKAVAWASETWPLNCKPGEPTSAPIKLCTSVPLWAGRNLLLRLDLISHVERALLEHFQP